MHACPIDEDDIGRVIGRGACWKRTNGSVIEFGSDQTAFGVAENLPVALQPYIYIQTELRRISEAQFRGGAATGERELNVVAGPNARKQPPRTVQRIHRFAVAPRVFAFG